MKLPFKLKLKYWIRCILSDYTWYTIYPYSKELDDFMLHNIDKYDIKIINEFEFKFIKNDLTGSIVYEMEPLIWYRNHPYASFAISSDSATHKRLIGRRPSRTTMLYCGDRFYEKTGINLFKCKNYLIDKLLK